jgi:hypothetical protein
LLSLRAGVVDGAPSTVQHQSFELQTPDYCPPDSIAMSDKQNLLEIKQKLAEKYEHLAAIAGSQPKRKQFSNRARKYRRQMEQISRTIEG